MPNDYVHEYNLKRLLEDKVNVEDWIEIAYTDILYYGERLKEARVLKHDSLSRLKQIERQIKKVEKLQLEKEKGGI